MPFNGTGVFTRRYSWTQDANQGINISSSRMDDEDNGFAAGLSNCITRDGQGIPTADINWGNNKITNLKAPVNPNDAVNLAFVATSIQNGTYDYAADTGAANTYAITLTPAPTAYTAGQRFRVKIANANTGAATLNVNGLGAKNIVRRDGSVLQAGDLQSGSMADFEYDGTNFQLVSGGLAATPIYYVPVRQTVLSGSVDVNGLANFLSAGSGLSVNLSATATPITLAFAAGFGTNGAIDYTVRITTDMTGAWSNLPASSTVFLYVDRNVSTGALTYGYSTLSPNYQYAAASTTNNQHTFVIPSMTMYVGNGSTASAVQRVFVGECITGSSTVTSVTTYAYQGRYESQGTAITYSATTAFNHNIGCTPKVAEVVIRNLSPDLGYAPGDEVAFKTRPTASESPVHNPIYRSRVAGGVVLDQTIFIESRTTFTHSGITTANWQLVARLNRGW